MSPRRDERDSFDERNRQMGDQLAQGASPDAVGEMVLAAVRDNHLYIRMIYAAIEARTRALLDVMPADA